jgi:hypothetical protein
LLVCMGGVFVHATLLEMLSVCSVCMFNREKLTIIFSHGH